MIDDLIETLESYKYSIERIEKKATYMDATLPFFQLWQVFDSFTKEKPFILSICRDKEIEEVLVADYNMTVKELIEKYLRPVFEEINAKSA